MNKDIDFLLMSFIASLMGFMVLVSVWSLIIYLDQIHYLIKCLVISLSIVQLCVTFYFSIKIVKEVLL